MKEEQEERHLRQGSLLLSRTAKAKIEEKGFLVLETEFDYLELDEQEALRLFTFLRDSLSDSLVEVKLVRLCEYVQRGEASSEAARTRLLELLLPYVPTPLGRGVQAVVAALSKHQDKEANS
jgi:hypothetical protein